MAQFGIDTLRVARELEAAGIGRKQAEATAAAINDAVGPGYRNLVTRADLGPVEVDVEQYKADVVLLRKGLDFIKENMVTREDLREQRRLWQADILASHNQLKADLFRALWMQFGATVAAFGGMMVAFVQVFH